MQRARVVTVVALVLLVAVSGFALRSGWSPGAAGLPHPAVVPVLASSGESPACAALVTNSTLGATYSGIYAGLPNSTTGGAGNSSGIAPRSDYPNVTVGTAQLVAAWASICDGSTYASIRTTWGTQGFFTGTQLDGSSGHYLASFGQQYPCSGSSWQGSCREQIIWYVDLATGTVDGPYTSSAGPPLGTPGSGSATSGALAGLTSSEWFGVGMLAVLAVALAAAGVLIRARTLRREGKELLEGIRDVISRGPPKRP